MGVTSSRQIEQTAAAWLARRDAGDWSERDQAQLDAWLDASVAHRVAFVRLDAAWRQTDRLKALGAGLPAGTVPPRGQWTSSPFPAAGEESLRRSGSPAASGPVDAAALVFSRGTPPEKSARPFRYAVASAAAVLLTASLAIGWRYRTAVEETSHRTAVGALQSVSLSDGSVATLSSDSRIVVRLSRNERRIDLQKGEAFFQVAKEAGRPFVVAAFGHRTVAVGTRFAVRRNDAGLRVVVTEGVVRLEPEQTPAGRRQPATLLPAGSVALASAAGILVRSGSVDRAEEYLSWRSGYLAFHDTPLSAAAAEFNRYNTRRIVIEDPTVAAMRVGGNFRWSNTDAFVRLLEQGFPIKAEYRSDSIVLRSQ